MTGENILPLVSGVAEPAIPAGEAEPAAAGGDRRERVEWLRDLIRQTMMQGKPDRTPWLTVPSRSEAPSKLQAQPRRVVLLGPPGVGKGTQAELLSERFGICNFSTSNLLRSARTLGPCACAPAITRSVATLRAGDTVSAETILGLVRQRSACVRCGGGFLINGFPNNVRQAELLDETLASNRTQLEAVVHYELSLEKIVARVSGRRCCPNCKGVYHLEARRPRRAGFCDHCGLVLQQRDGDRPEILRARMEIYRQSTLPLVEFYRTKGLLVSVSAEGTPGQIFERTLEALESEAAA